LGGIAHMIKYIPNTITAFNILSGCIAVIFALEGNPHISGWLIFLSAFLDFMDGFIARIIKAQTNTGKELDSLADLISFGLAPATIMYVLIASSLDGIENEQWLTTLLPFAAFLITICSAIRLAKFNVDKRPKELFYGLPTPANAIFIGSLPLILQQDLIFIWFQAEPVKSLVTNTIFLVSLTILLSYLLVSDIRLISLKFTSFGWSQNRIRYIFLLISLLLFIMFFYAGIPLIIISYIIFSQLSSS
jgi:CDP-diacylglycerol---serine O-phosphatidyltransferase